MIQLLEDDQATLRIERRGDGQLWASRDGEAHVVSVHRCFPWSEPDRFLSLRDVDEKEFALVVRLSDVDDASADTLRHALIEAGFVLEIVRIVDVNEEVEIRTWSVETIQGARTFQTKLDDWPIEVPNGGILIRDVAGDLYHVRSPSTMDAASQKWLWAFVD